MFGFKPMITGSSVMISSNRLEPTRFDSMSKASTSTGIPYATLLYTKRNSKSRIHCNGKEYVIKFITSNFKRKATDNGSGVGRCSCDQTFECASERELAMKCRMHLRFCSNPPVAFDKISVPKKACTMREQQLNEAEKIRKVHN